MIFRGFVAVGYWVTCSLAVVLLTLMTVNLFRIAFG